MNLAKPIEEFDDPQYRELLVENAVLEKRIIELEQYADVLAHDLRAPLKNINNLAVMLRLDKGTVWSSGAEANLQKLQDHARNMHQLILDLREISKHNIYGLKFDWVDTNVILHDLFEQYQSDLDKQEGEIELTHLPSVYAHSQLLWQLFDNLLRNALAHGGKPLQIFVEAKKLGDVAEFVFSNLTSSASETSAPVTNSKSEKKSTGLGLGICKRIIELHKGTIFWQESEGRFRVIFTLQISENG